MANKEAPSELIRAKDLGAFDRWALPSFDPQGTEPAAAPAAPADSAAAQGAESAAAQVEEVALEAVKPLTL
ncbi:MAG: flagellar assembly protein FliH, partial [Pseudomonas sp.]